MRRALACLLVGCSNAPAAPDAGDAAASCDAVELVPAPSAILFVLQSSASMALGDKWSFARQAIVRAVDQPAFDALGVGLLAAPSRPIKGPACVGFVEVPCGVPAFPQVPMRVAGSLRSTDDTGVRHDLSTWLADNAPTLGSGDGNPLYTAIESGAYMLRSIDAPTRTLFVITDGQLSCASVASRPGFKDVNGCLDWEDPNNVIDLLKRNYESATAPVHTFVVGVPGADSFDPNGVIAPPYRMRAALSAIAKAGAPDAVPAGCDAQIPFAPSAPDPKTSCHFDMAKDYSPELLAAAITRVQGARCQFTTRRPIDFAKIEVSFTSNGQRATLPRRGGATCDMCWDALPSGLLEVYGGACSGTIEAKVKCK